MELMQASNQWASRPADERFQTLQALRESVANRRMRSRSVDIELPSISVTVKPAEEGSAETLAINNAVAPSEPSHWAFSQFAGALLNLVKE